MLVDDVEYSRELLRNAIKASILDKNLNLEPSYLMLSGGRAAIKMVENKDIPLVFLDIELLDISGIDVLKKIKSKHPGTYVVMVSGESSADNVNATIEQGANGFIVKPFSTEKITQALKNFIKHTA
jgi:DNA-binding NtrC family response regulator